jgi:hypothetical protein
VAHGDDLVSLVSHVFDMAERDAARRQSQAARREALQSAVKLIRRRFGAGAARWASEIMEPAP